MYKLLIILFGLFLFTGCEEVSEDEYQVLNYEPVLNNSVYLDYVIDGDTLMFYTLGSVRLQGIDTPERSSYFSIEDNIDQQNENSRLKEQANECTSGDINIIMNMGELSTRYVLDKIGTYTYYFDVIDMGTDYYGRMLGIVKILNSGSLNKSLVRDGYAYPFMDNEDIYAEDLIFAKNNNRGLWSSYPEEMECLSLFYGNR